MAEVAPLTLASRGTLADIPGLRALGEAVVPPTYGPIDAAYAQRMLDEWWTPEVFAASLARNAHVVAERDGRGGRRWPTSGGSGRPTGTSRTSPATAR